MIQFFRNFFSSKLGVVFAILFIGLIGLAFALADINAPGGGFGGSATELVSVGDESIEEERIQTLLNRALQDAREEQPGIDMNAFVEQGALEDALEARIRNAALGAFADDNGFAVSKRLIDGVISSIPTFQGLTGEFDETAFRQVLQRQNLSEEEVRDDLRGQTFVRLILGPVTAATRVSEAAVRPFAGLLLEERSGQILAVPSAAMPQGEAPTSAQVSAFYNENQQRYTLPERRSVRYATFSLEQVAIPEPTEEQVREYYQSNSEEYGAIEQRSFRQVILPNEEQARAFYAAVNGGSSFDAEATSRGFPQSATSVESTTEPAFERNTSAEIATAAFAADEGELLSPRRSGLGWHVVQVAAVDRREQTPLRNVRAQIVTTLQSEGREDALNQFYLDIENAIDDGASFEEIADDKGLTIQATPLLTPNGSNPEEPDYRPSPALGPVLQAAFTLDEDEDPMVIAIEENQRFAMVDVTQIARTAPQPLARIQQIVRRDFLLDRASTRAQRIANGIAEKVNDGTSLAEAIADAGVTLPAAQPARATRRQIAAQGQNVPAPLRLMFRMAAETAKLVRLPQQQGWFVVILDEIQSNAEELTDEMVAATQQQFSTIVANEYAEQFLNAVLAEYPAERNEEAIQAFSDRLTGRAN